MPLFKFDRLQMRLRASPPPHNVKYYEYLSPFSTIYCRWPRPFNTKCIHKSVIQKRICLDSLLASVNVLDRGQTQRWIVGTNIDWRLTNWLSVPFAQTCPAEVCIHILKYKFSHPSIWVFHGLDVEQISLANSFAILDETNHFPFHTVSIQIRRNIIYKLLTR